MSVCPFCHNSESYDGKTCTVCGVKGLSLAEAPFSSEFLDNCKFLVIGGGSIGKRQIGNFLSLGIAPERIALSEIREDRRTEIQNLYGLKKIYTDTQSAYAAEKYTAVLVSSPTAFHIEHGMEALKNDCHVFMEKALSHNCDGVEDFLREAERRKKIILVGYTYRFWPPLRRLKEILDIGTIGKVLAVRTEFSEYLPDWHPWDVKEIDGKKVPDFYMAKKVQGGGELLDESHAIDYLRWFFGEIKEVSAFVGKVSDIVMDTDDYSQIIAVFESGLVGSIHLDCFGRRHRKEMEIIGEKGNIYWDFYANTIELYDGETKQWAKEQFKCQRNDMFLEECRHFLACVNGTEMPLIDGWDGYKTIKVCMAAEDSWSERRFKEVK